MLLGIIKRKFKNKGLLTKTQIGKKLIEVRSFLLEVGSFY